MAGKEAIAQRQLAGNGSSPKFGLTITRKVNFDNFRWKFEPKISVVRLDSGVVAPFINLIKSLILKITIKSNKKSN